MGFGLMSLSYICGMHLYVHIPFCARRCSYCDFAIAVRREVPSRRFVDAILTEWQRWSEWETWEWDATLATIYLGGGTPSRLDPLELDRLLKGVRAHRALAPDAEVTLEANPEDVTAERVTAWLGAGVNRISLGIQSFDDRALTWMHRVHDAERARLAVKTLRNEGVSNLSLDLIFALPSSLGRHWQRDVDEALGLEPQHLSLYGLTVEEKTPLGRWTARGSTIPADDERYAAEYLAAHESLLAAGFDHYEVSNAGRPGFRARHNSAYWTGARYLGLGPSAHSAADGVRWWNVPEWAAYDRAMEAAQSVEAGRESLTPDQMLLERRYLGLRTSDGVALADAPPEAATWQELGWARQEGSRLTLTIEGWLRLDALLLQSS